MSAVMTGKNKKKNRVMQMCLSLVLFLAPWLFAGAAWTDADSMQFGKANEAYRKADYQSAIKLYGDLTAIHSRNATLHYNLANSFYRDGRLGESILHYERALRIEPRNADIRNNLAFVQSMLEYRVEDTRNWYVRTGEQILMRFTEREVVIFTALCYALLVGSWCVALFFRSGAPWSWRRKSALVVLLIALVLLFSKNLETRFFRDAIVLDDEVEVRYGPSDADQTAFRLGTGLKVYVVDRRPEWSRILLVNGKGGWVRNRRLAEVIM
jgi:tetratricopeptide (TPR) repeat protein